MGINRFEVARPAQYIPTNIPLPFDDLMKAGAVKEARADRAWKEQDQLTGMLAAIAPAPGHEDYAKEVIGKYKGQIANVVNNYDPTDPKFMSNVRVLESQLANDPDVKNIISSKQQYDKMWSPIMNDPKNKQAIYSMPGVFDNKQKQFIQNKSRYDNLNYTPEADHNRKIDDYLKDVEYRVAKSSGYSTFKDPTTGYMMLATNKGPIKVRELPEFKQAIEGLTKTFMDPHTSESAYFKAATEDQFGQGAYTPDYVKSYITDRARRFFNTQDLRETDYNFVPGQFNRGNQEKDQNSNAATTGQTEITTNADNVSVNPIVKNIKFENGQVTPFTQSQVESAPQGVLGGSMLALPNTQIVQKKSTPEQVEQQKQFLNGIRTNSPSLANLNDEETYNAYKEAQEGNASVSVPWKRVDEVEPQFHKQVFNAGLNTRGITIARSKNAISKPVNFDIVAKDLGLKKEDLQRQLKDGYVAGIGNGNTPGQFIVTVQDGSGQPVQLMVNGDKEQQVYYSRSWMASSLERKGEPGKLSFQDPVDGQPYITNTEIVKQQGSKAQFNTTTYGAQVYPTSQYTEKDLKDNNISIYSKGKYNGQDVWFVADPDLTLQGDDILNADHARYQHTDYYPKKNEVRNPVDYSTGELDYEE